MHIRLVLLILVSISVMLVAQEPPVRFEDRSDLIPFERTSVLNGGDGIGGVAWLDYNNDSYLDLYLSNGLNAGGVLYANDGEGGFTDVTQAAGLTHTGGVTGVTAADIDNDGFQDLLLTGDGSLVSSTVGPLKLFHNNGDGTFSDITVTSGVSPDKTASMAAFGDIDNDGDLDLFLAGIGALFLARQDQNRLFLNNGDLTFTDISESAGVNTALGACVVNFTDQNSDGWMDIMVGVCNDINLAPTQFELFRNNGDLTFTDVAPEANLDVDGYWMSMSHSDYDNDGDMDFFSTSFGDNSPAGQFRSGLFRNNGDGTYTNVAEEAGVSRSYFGWGSSFTDFDNDGFSDIYYVGALVMGFVRLVDLGEASPGAMFFNNTDGTFTDFTAAMPVNFTGHYSSGLAAGDYDNDGFSDLVVITDRIDDKPGSAFLLHNQGNTNNHITLSLQGVRSNRFGVGARVRVVAGDLSQTREVFAGNSFASTESFYLTFGLGARMATDLIEVRWPSGLVERFENLATGSRDRLVEGSGAEVSETFKSNLLFPWVSNSDTFGSTLVVNNLGDQPVTVRLSAVQGVIVTPTERTVPAGGFLRESAADLFPQLSGGYAVRVQSTSTGLAGRLVTSAKGSASAGSPSQGNAIDLSHDNTSGQAIAYAYLPAGEGLISAPVVVNSSFCAISANLVFYNSNGERVHSEAVEDLAPFSPRAFVTSQLVPDAGDLWMRAESDSGALTGVTFIFNQSGGAAIGDITVVSAPGQCGDNP